MGFNMKDMFLPVVKTKVGTKYMVSSQSVCLTGENPEFEIFLDEWSCVVRYLDDAENERSRYKIEVVEEKLYINLYNHNSKKGEFIYSPFKVAKAGRWQVYLTYFSELHGGSIVGARKFDYQVWVEEIA